MFSVDEDENSDLFENENFPVNNVTEELGVFSLTEHKSFSF